MNIDDLERPWISKIDRLAIFYDCRHAVHTAKVNWDEMAENRWLKIDQNNLCIKFLAQNINNLFMSLELLWRQQLRITQQFGFWNICVLHGSALT